MCRPQCFPDRHGAPVGRFRLRAPPAGAQQQTQVVVGTGQTVANVHSLRMRPPQGFPDRHGAPVGRFRFRALPAVAQQITQVVVGTGQTVAKVHPLRMRRPQRFPNGDARLKVAPRCQRIADVTHGIRGIKQRIGRGCGAAFLRGLRRRVRRRAALTGHMAAAGLLN